jgi:hypothetical protein
MKIMKYIIVLLLSVLLIPLMQTAYSQSIMDQIGGAFKNATSGAGQAINNATSGAGQASNNATSGAGQASNNATSGASNAMNSTAENAGDAANYAGGAAKGGVNDIQKTIGDVIGKIIPNK